MVKYNFDYQSGVLKLRHAGVHDICVLKDKLRKEEVESLWSGFRASPEIALVKSYGASEVALTIELDGVPVAMMGAIRDPKDPSIGNIWLMGSDETDRVGLSFVRVTKFCITELLKEFRSLYNYVDVRCVRVFPWLRILGAKIGEPQLMGVDQIPFRLYTIDREVT